MNILLYNRLTRLPVAETGEVLPALFNRAERFLRLVAGRPVRRIDHALVVASREKHGREPSRSSGVMSIALGPVRCWSHIICIYPLVLAAGLVGPVQRDRSKRGNIGHGVALRTGISTPSLRLKVGNACRPISTPMGIFLRLLVAGASEGRVTVLSFPISVGEAVDKITILRIKAARIGEPSKLENIRRELALLERLFSEQFPRIDISVESLIDELRRINETLWQIEDEIREHERRKDFGRTFVELARSVYLTNDRRAAVKRKINLALGSSLIEEKSYAQY